MTISTLGSGESKLETTISYLLIIGVAASLLLEVIGLILFYGDYLNLNILESSISFIQGKNFFSFMGILLQGEYTQNNAFLFMTMGLIVLILTPYIRIFTSIIYFGGKKDYKYVLVTVIVFIIITISLTLH